MLGLWHVSVIVPVVAEAARRPHPRVVVGGNRILMLTIGTIDHDPRVTKVAASLADGGFDVEVMSIAGGPELVEETVRPGVRYVRVPLLHHWRLTLMYQEAFRLAALGRSFDYVHANDLTTLPIAWVLARSRGARLVYDAHELWTENVEYNGSEWVPMRKRTRRVASFLEGRMLRSVDLLVTVSPSIARDFDQRHLLHSKPLLVPNFPSRSLLGIEANGFDLRRACKLDDQFVTLYMGGINSLRNIESVISAHRHLPPEHVFVVMGPGIELYERSYRALAEQEGVRERVFFLRPVAMNEVVAAAAHADCGIVMLRNLCKNFYYFFPNKLFEYAAAGIPIAASAFPDTKAFIDAERCGVTFDPDDPRSIAAALRWLREHPDEAQEMGRRGRDAVLRDMNWETTAAGLLEAYHALQ
jgi:glycosyltransferase involved in cell wall biosynthesis